MKIDQLFQKKCLFLKKIMDQIYNQMKHNHKVKLNKNKKIMQLIYQIFLIILIKNKKMIKHNNKKHKNKIYIKTYKKTYNKTSNKTCNQIYLKKINKKHNRNK